MTGPTLIKYLNVLHHSITQKQLHHFFLKILWKCYQDPILGTLDTGHFNQKQELQIVETLMFICMKKIKSILTSFLRSFILYVFLEILERYYKLVFWIFSVCLAMHTESDSISLQKTLMLICIPKMNLTTSSLRYYIWSNPAIWLGDSILANNSRTRILSNMGLVVKYQ